MQNLLLFLWRYNNFLIFLILEAICLMLFVNNNSTQGQVFMSTANSFSATVLGWRNNFTRYWYLAEENRILQEKLAEQMSNASGTKFSNKTEVQHINNSEYEQRYKYITAEVVNNSTGQPNNFITINRGYKHGVKPHAAVVGANGVVGIVVKCSRHFSVVMSILNQSSQISAKLARSHYFGSLVWRGTSTDEMYLEDIPKQAEVEVGDSVLTSGYSQLFPKGIPIGTVVEDKITGGSNYHTIRLTLVEDLNRIQYVYVVQDLFKNELKQLEEAVIKNGQ